MDFWLRAWLLGVGITLVLTVVEAVHKRSWDRKRTRLLFWAATGVFGYVVVLEKLYAFARWSFDRTNPAWPQIKVAKQQREKLIILGGLPGPGQRNYNKSVHDEFQRVHALVKQLRSAADREKAIDELATVQATVDDLARTVGETDQALAARVAAYDATRS